MVFYPMLVTIPKELSANFASVKIAPLKTELASKEFASIASLRLFFKIRFNVLTGFEFVSNMLQIRFRFASNPFRILFNHRC